MKKLILIFVTFIMAFSLTACGKTEAASSSQKPMSETPSESTSEETASIALDSVPEDGILDLTTLSSTVVYAEVYNMMMSPEDYVGRTVKMSGQFAAFADSEEGPFYYACLIADATACCQQGIEFVLADGSYDNREDYPELGTEVTVTGEFRTYEENGMLYCHLVNAVMLIN